MSNYGKRSLKILFFTLICINVVISVNADTTVIYSNSKFTFYNDHLVSNDYYIDTCWSTNGQVITRTSDPSSVWNSARLDKLFLQTPYPILDAAYALAIREALGNIAPAGTTSAMLTGDVPGGQYYYPYFYVTHGTDIREYSRDTAQHVQVGDSVILDRATVKGTMIRRCDFAANSIREDAVVTADSVHLIAAAWEYYKITGDADFLAKVWTCFWNSINVKEASKKQANGLWLGSPWSDNVSGFVSSAHFDNRNTSVQSLYGNTVVAGAWQALANIASVLGKTSEASTCTSKYNAMKTAINNVLYRPEFGTYCYYLYTPTGAYYNYREDISAGMLYLYGIADSAKTMAYHNKFTKTNYGYRNVDPVLPAGESSYHGGNVWEDLEMYHGWAMAKLKQADVLKDFVFWHARQGLVLGVFREGTINPSTGLLHSNYTRMIWSELGYTSYWSRGIFGISYDTDGIRFQPVVPSSFGNGFYAVLNNFTYRTSTLRLILVGMGTTVDQITLDGTQITVVPTNLTGNHTVKVYMSGNTNPTIPTMPAPIAGRLEAENAALVDCSINTNHAGYSGTGFIDQYKEVNNAVTFTVSVPSAGSYGVTLRYANSTGSAKTTSLYVNGAKIRQITLANLANWDTWGDRVDTVSLNSGSNTIKYQVDSGDTAYVNLDYIHVPTGEYQGEAYTAQSGCVIANANGGYTGSGYLDLGGNGTYGEWNNVYCSTTGTKTITFTYANGSTANRQCEITVNGVPAGNVAFAATGSWTAWGTVTINVPMNSGSNTVRVTANTGNGGPNVDKFTVKAAL